MSLPKVSVLLSVYRAERYLHQYLENVLEQTLGEAVELSVVHNDPTPGERSILDAFDGRIRMIRSETERESLYKSWNRAIAQSSGDYLACWNADDLRTPDSLERMARTLDEDSEAGWTYGDFLISRCHGNRTGRHVRSVEWSRDRATRGAIGGPFFVWRRNLLEQVGWFDEQFRSGGDFDYTARLSLASRGARTPGMLGYFLSTGEGLSTSGELQPIERTVIQLRYGIYETVDWHYVPPSLQYRVQPVLQPEGRWVRVQDSIPDYESLIASRRFNAWRIPVYSCKILLYRAVSRVMRRT